MTEAEALKLRNVIWRLVSSRIEHRETAEDVTQDAILSILSRSVPGGEKFQAVQAAKDAVARYYRERAARAARAEMVPLDGDVAVPDTRTFSTVLSEVGCTAWEIAAAEDFCSSRRPGPRPVPPSVEGKLYRGYAT